MNTTSAHRILDQMHALGDGTRTRILSLLERSEFTVSELCAVLQAPQPTVSRQLKVLADQGWVEARQDGRLRHYRMSAAANAPVRSIWRIVRPELTSDPVFAADAERAEEVLRERRLHADAFFAQAAGRWDDLRAELFGPAVRFAPLYGLLDPAWTVGDLGSGTGAMVEMLAPFVRRVIGVDRSAEMLSAAGLRLEGVPNVELRRGTLERLPIEDGALDLAILSLVLHFVTDPARVLGEAGRALASGGRVVVIDMRPHERGVGYADEMGHVWPGFEPARIEDWLSDAGYHAPRVHPLPPDPGAKGPLLFLATAVQP